MKSESPLDVGASLTGHDQLTGTPRYMAPETIAHPNAAEPRSDLYAAAALGYLPCGAGVGVTQREAEARQRPGVPPGATASPGLIS